MISQNLLNLVDTAMVGTLGDAALAAVGVGGFANFFATSTILGLAVGVQAMAARRKGEGAHGQEATALNAGLIIALLIALPLSLILIYFTPAIFPYLNGDSAVIAAGVPYLQFRLAAMVAMGMNFSFRGFWNGVNKASYYMTTLVVMHIVNIFLNYLLIFGKLGFPAMGAAGAGLASAIATFMGTGIYFYLGFRHARPQGFLSQRPSRSSLQTLIRIAIPSSIQQLFFSAGFLILYWIVGKVGTAELAAANVLINITLVTILPGIGLGLSASTLVGQALGRKDPEDARRWGWDVVKVGVVLLSSFGLLFITAPQLILSVFIHDPNTLALAKLPLQLVGIMVGVDVIGLILMHALLGTGDSRTVMRVSIGLQWGLFLPSAWIIGPVLGFGLLGIWIAQGVYRFLMALMCAYLWQKGEWKKVKV